jgi:hypothetical protein
VLAISTYEVRVAIMKLESPVARVCTRRTDDFVGACTPPIDPSNGDIFAHLTETDASGDQSCSAEECGDE